MDRLDLSDYINNHPFAQDTIIKSVKDKDIGRNVSVFVFYEDIMFDGRKSRFLLFTDNTLAASILDFPCSIGAEDVISIAKNMIKEYLYEVQNTNHNISIIDYNSVNDEYIEYKQKKVLEKYFIDEFEFNITNKRWNKKYGHKSKKHKDHIHGTVVDCLSEYLVINGDDVDYISDLVEYIKVYSNEDCKFLFK